MNKNIIQEDVEKSNYTNATESYNWYWILILAALFFLLFCCNN